MNTHDNAVRRLTERYRLGRVLEATSSSTVYMATTHGVEGRLVVKVVAREASPSEWSWHSQFEAAMSAVHRLHLPTFPAIIEAGWLSDDEAYLVMKAVEGVRLDLAARPAPPFLLVMLARLATALEALHKAGTAHLNLSPRNVLLVEPGKETVGVLLGLGTGWLRPSGVDREFAAPELGEHAGAPEPWACDVFAFAHTLCWTLGVTVLPEGRERVLVRLPGEVEALLENPVAFGRLLEAAMARSPADRPHALEEIATALRRATPALGGEDPSRRDSAGTPIVEPRPATAVALDDTAKIRVTAVTPPGATADGTRVAARGAVGDREGALDDTIHIDAPSLQVALERHRRTRADAPEPPTVDNPQRRSAPVSQGAGPEPDAGLDRTVRVNLPAMAGAGVPGEKAGDVGPPSREVGPSRVSPSPTTPANAAVFSPIDRRDGRPWDRRPVVWGIGASLCFALAVVLSMVFGGSHEPSGENTAGRASVSARASSPASAVPRPTPDLLEKAEKAFADGDFAAAEETLDRVIRDDSRELSPDDQARAASLHRSLAERRQWDRIRELDSALVAGDLVRLRESVESFASGEPAAADNSVEVQRKLALARRLVERQDRLIDAERDGSWGDVIESAEAILTALPKCGAAAAARERAATELEIEADALARNGNPAAAIERLEPLRRWWPDRSELDTRLRSFERRREEIGLVQETVRRAEREGSEGRPDAGLELLAGLAPGPALAGTVESLREQLQEDLNRRDARSPVLTLMPGTGVDYEKDQPIRIVLHVEDDYHVVTVTLYARSEGTTSFTRFVTVASGDHAYTANIPPEFHRNRTVQYYAAATDPSQHRGELGNAAQPLEIKRRRWHLFHR